MTQFEAADPEKVIIGPTIRNIFDQKRPESVDNFYAKSLLMWITRHNPDKIGVLPPNSVDNCVDNVDFWDAHTLYMQGPHTFHRSNCYKMRSLGSKQGRGRGVRDPGDGPSPLWWDAFFVEDPLRPRRYGHGYSIENISKLLIRLKNENKKCRHTS